MGKIRILYINTKFCGGGAEKVARQLYEGLALEDNIETFFLEGRRTHYIDEFIYNDKGVNKAINSIKSYISNNERVKDSYAIHRIIRTIKKYKIDIVHFHNIHGNYMGIKDILEIQKYCKIVWTLHDMWLLTGHCAHSLECTRWRDESCNKCKRLDLYPMIRTDIANKIYNIKKSVVMESNVVYVVPSQWLLQECDKSFLNRETKFLVYNGVNTSVYVVKDKNMLRDKYHIKSEKIVLAFGASDLESSYKGMDILIQALENVKDKNKYSLVIFGNKNNLSINQEYECCDLGYIHDESVMNDIYSLADVFILPSIAENFPCSILESFASGTPVIASNVGGISEQIDAGTGWLFEKGNSKQLTKLIENLDQEKEKFDDMRVNCRKRVEEHFTEKQMIEDYKKLYIEMMN